MAADIDRPRSQAQAQDQDQTQTQTQIPKSLIPAVHSPGRKEYEMMRAYNALTRAGGRPACPLGETARVSACPERHREMLSPWVEGPLEGCDLDWKDIYQQQLANWQRFRAWQQSNRGPMAFPTAADADEGFESSSSSSGSNVVSNFGIHMEATKHRLARHGFLKPVSLKKEASKQSEWITWVEYLSFEYYCFERYTSYSAPGGLGDLHAAMLRGQVPMQMENSGQPAETRSQEYGGDGSLDFWAQKHHDAGFHHLILKWALRQEPEILTKLRMERRANPPPLQARFLSESPRQKRLRDGSLRNANPTS